MKTGLVIGSRIANAIRTINAESDILGSAVVGSCESLTFYVEFGAGTTAGVVTVETAAYAGYTGTWSSIGTIAWAAASRVGHLSVQAVHGAVRSRISTAIVGGTVDIWVYGR